MMVAAVGVSKVSILIVTVSVVIVMIGLRSGRLIVKPRPRRD